MEHRTRTHQRVIAGVTLVVLVGSFVAEAEHHTWLAITLLAGAGAGVLVLRRRAIARIERTPAE